MKALSFRWAAARLLFLLFVLLAGADGARIAAAEADAAASGADHPFVSGVVWQVHFEIPADEYAAMQPRGRGGFPGFGWGPVAAAPAAADDDGRQLHRNTFGVNLPWGSGAVTFGGQRFDNVGIRYKGNGTIMDARESAKKSFKVELDHFGGDGKFLGQKTINLHCGVTDPTKSRETLGYGLYRQAGVPASRTALAEVRLTVPGKFDNELLGVYTMVEQVGGKFLREHFGSDEGLLMKPEGIRDFDDLGAYWPAYEPRYQPKREATDAEAARVIALSQLVHNADDAEFEREIRGFLDVDAYLRFLAVTAYVANSDSFFVLGHNYNLYLHPTTQQFHFIPWDLDRAFGNFIMFGSHEQLMDLSMVHPYPGTHRLTERLLAMPEVSARYQAILGELAATCFAKEPLLAEIAALEEATRELIAREQSAATDRGEGRNDDRDAGFGPPPGFGAPPDLREFVETRTVSVAAQLAGTSTGHVPTGGWGPPGGPGGPGRPGGPGGPRQGGFGGSPGRPRIGDMLGRPLMERYDADEDERVARSEWLGAAGALMDACPLEGDQGADEAALAEAIQGMMPQAPEGGPGPPGFSAGAMLAGLIVRRSDADGNGKVTRAELDAAAGVLFDEFAEQGSDSLDERAFARMLNELFPPPKFPDSDGPRAR